jgi:hypothetical protein
MYSDENIRNLYFKNMAKEVLIEGSLGTLTSVNFVEDLMLEIRGENGVLRIDVDKAKVINALTKATIP